MKRNKHKVTKSGKSHAASITTGVVVALLLSIVLTGLLTNIVLNGQLNENSVSGIMFVIRAISLFVGALIGASLLKESYLKLVGSIAGSYFIILIGAGIAFYDGSFKDFVLGLISVLVGGVGALLILQRPKASRYKHNKLNR